MAGPGRYVVSPAVDAALSDVCHIIHSFRWCAAEISAVYCARRVAVVGVQQNVCLDSVLVQYNVLSVDGSGDLFGPLVCRIISTDFSFLNIHLVETDILGVSSTRRIVFGSYR